MATNGHQWGPEDTDGWCLVFATYMGTSKCFALKILIFRKSLLFSKAWLSALMLHF
jgi:hypothetical protein